MAQRSCRPLAQCLQVHRRATAITLPIRSFTKSAARQANETEKETLPKETETPSNETTTTTTPPKARRTLNPSLVSSPRQERRLLRLQKQLPIGSRRRRAALASTTQIPFEQLPYQCFQEARKFLQADREVKLKEIRLQRDRIERLQEKVVIDSAEQAKKEKRLRDMRHRLERAKVWADINDPLIKKKFEDGQGDMSKPIYRHLADKKWRSYAREVLLQRIHQMNVVPDLLPAIDPVVSTALSFPLAKTPWKRRNIPHGEMVESALSESPPVLRIQPYQKGERLVTIAVMNPDVPNVEKDSFDSRCHFLAINVPITPEGVNVKFASLDPEAQVIHPWLPAYSQMGAPYQRLAIFVLEQAPSEKMPVGSGLVAPSSPLSVQRVKKSQGGKYASREGFSLRALVQNFHLKPVGVDLFRTVWDEGTAGVMKRAGIPGWDVEFKRKRIEPLPYKRLKEERFR